MTRILQNENMILTWAMVLVGSASSVAASSSFIHASIGDLYTINDPDVPAEHRSLFNKHLSIHKQRILVQLI